MSQYYLSQTKRPISRERSHQQERTDNNADTTSYDSLGESAIYIFPNPLSGPPSPSQSSSSNLSVDTDFHLSAIDTDDELGRPSDSGMSSYAESSPLSESFDLLEPASPREWTPDLRTERVIEAPADATQLPLEDMFDQYPVLMRRQGQGMAEVFHKHQRSLSDNSLDDSKFSGVDPTNWDKGRHIYHLPLFSLLVSLLSIDQSTAALFTSHSPQTFLFPGSNLVSAGGDSDQEANGCVHEKATHCPGRLLANADVQAYKSLRDGLSVAAEYHSDASPLLSASMSLCNVVTDLIADPVNALRDLFSLPSTID